MEYPKIEAAHLSEDEIVMRTTQANQLAVLLGEDPPVPTFQLRLIACVRDVAFLDEAYRKVLDIEEAGGIMRKDGSGRRTMGGLFFQLAWKQLSKKERRWVNKRLRPLKAAVREQAAAEVVAARPTPPCSSSVTLPDAGDAAPSPG